MKFSFEVPISYLNYFHKYQDYLLVLSHLLPLPVYESYFLKKKKGMLSIIDNAFNELQVPNTPEEMSRLFYKYQPTLVTSPDSDRWDTQQTVEAYIELKESVPNENILCLFKNLEEYYILRAKGCKHLGSSFWWRPHIKDFPSSRDIFYYGFLNFEEYRKYKPFYCDTGMPIKLALKGYTIEEWVEQDCFHIHSKDFTEYLHSVLDPKTLELAEKNILTFKEICNGKL